MSAFLIPITEGEAPGIFPGGEVAEQDKKGFIITDSGCQFPPVLLTAAWPWSPQSAEPEDPHPQRCRVKRGPGWTPGSPLPPGSTAHALSLVSRAPDHSALSEARTLFVDVEERGPEAMDVKERKPYRSLTRRRDAERRYTSSSADSEEGKAPQKSYSSSETLKAYDQDARLTYGSRVKDLVPQEAEEFCRAGEGGRVGVQDAPAHGCAQGEAGRAMWPGWGRACAQVCPGTAAHVVYTGAAGELTREPSGVERSPSTPALRCFGRLALVRASAVVRSWFIHLPAHPSCGRNETVRCWLRVSPCLGLSSEQFPALLQASPARGREHSLLP